VLCVWEIQLDSSARLTMCCNCVSLCSSGMILARGVPWRCSPFLFLLANIVYSDSTYLHSFSFIRQLSNGVYIYTWIIKACMKNVHYYWCYLVLRLLELASAFFRTKNPLLWNMDWHWPAIGSVELGCKKIKVRKSMFVCVFMF